MTRPCALPLTCSCAGGVSSMTAVQIQMSAPQHQSMGDSRYTKWGETYFGALTNNLTLRVQYLQAQHCPALVKHIWSPGHRTSIIEVLLQGAIPPALQGLAVTLEGLGHSAVSIEREREECERERERQQMGESPCKVGTSVVRQSQYVTGPQHCAHYRSGGRRREALRVL
eukprot:1251190-Amphidinium_carterae.1